jgi:hypothetical protein
MYRRVYGLVFVSPTCMKCRRLRLAKCEGDEKNVGVDPYEDVNPKMEGRLVVCALASFPILSLPSVCSPPGSTRCPSFLSSFHFRHSASFFSFFLFFFWPLSQASQHTACLRNHRWQTRRSRPFHSCYTPLESLVRTSANTATRCASS